MGVGTVDGAVYIPLLSMNPTEALPPGMPFTEKVRGVPLMVEDALNWSVWPARTELLAGERET